MRYGSIIVDPPWEYPRGLWQRKKSQAASHYPTMLVEEIKALPVPQLAEANAFCWMWIPTYHLIRGIGADVMSGWGFRPITTLVWCKRRIGLGKYIRNAHEQVLLGVRGRVEFKAKDQGSWFVAPRGRHSSKPKELHRVVERCCHGPYLEMFAREAPPREGWSYWGNELLKGENVIEITPAGAFVCPESLAS